MTHEKTGDAVLAVRGLTVSLPPGMDREHAVTDIGFDLAAGEILCVVGESGSGKSVTANAIMGLLPKALRVTSGAIRMGDVDLLEASDATLRDLRGRVVSIIFQDPLSALNPLMTIGAQIEEVLNAHGTSTRALRDARVVSLITEVGLPDPETIRHQYPFQLSGGQRQRVMIAIALALDPLILIADEPTTALDVTTQAQILDLIRRLQREKGMSVMFITHDFGVVAELADRVIVMEKGRLVEQGVAQDVLSQPQHPYTQRLLAAVPHMREAEDADRAGETATILEIENLQKVYKGRRGLFRAGRDVRAVHQVSLTLHRGETLGIVGESGSGKSTLGRLILRLLDSDRGAIRFHGADITSMSDKDFRSMRPKIQMVFQDPFASLNPRHTISQILTAGARAYGVSAADAEAKARRLLRLVGLDDGAFDRYPHEFSGGQRQRIGIARALMLDPEILVADEAVSALDVSIQAQILDLLQSLQADLHIAMVFITHDLRVASQICDHVAVMSRGEVVEYGEPSQIFQAPRDAYTRQLVGAVPGVAFFAPHRARAGASAADAAI